MATGVEMYRALRKAARELSEFAINRIDALDLQKLEASDLVSLDFDEQIAEEVSAALHRGDLEPLGQIMSLRLYVSPDAPALLVGA